MWEPNTPDTTEKRNRYYCTREWAKLRTAVIKRCDGVCERCHGNPVENVHHLSYLRLYNEPLEDLRGICRGCHEFTHDKSPTDPITELPAMIYGWPVKNVYFAGKVGQTCWRRQMGILTEDNEGHPLDDEHPRGDLLITLKSGKSLIYGGPFYTDMSGGHGWMSPGPHCSETPYKHPGNAVYRESFKAIDHCQAVVAWIDSRDCFGTIAELGYARAHDKLILMATPRLDPDLWFVYSLASDIQIVNDPRVAFDHWFAEGSHNQGSGSGQTFDKLNASYGDESKTFLESCEQYQNPHELVPAEPNPFHPDANP